MIAVSIGILQADSVLPEFQPEHGNYPEMFEQLLDAGNVTLRHYDVEHGVYPDSLDECDAYLITGSKKSVYDDDEWIRNLEAFVRQCAEQGKKLVGICFGHQLIAQALGGKTEPAEAGWGVGIHSNKVEKSRPFMSPARDDIGLVVSHKDQVIQLPVGAELIASNPHCPNAGYVIGEHVFCLQGHPEFTTDYSRTLMTFRREILGEDRYSAGIRSLDDPLDRELVAQWILQFVAGERG